MQNGFLNGERSSVTQFVLTYLGEYVLEKHCFNSSMLPWVMTAMYRQNFRRSVKLSLSSSILNCSSFNEANTILFQHSADSITRFTIAERRLKCFSYLVESGSTGGRTFFACHLFEANEEKQVRNRNIWKLINKICLGLARHCLDICLKNHFLYDFVYHLV